MVWKSLTLEDLTSLLDLLSASAEMGTVSPGTKAVLGRVSVAEMGPLWKGTVICVHSDTFLTGHPE